jgi:NitT/TauT family transport system permease protein
MRAGRRRGIATIGCLVLSLLLALGLWEVAIAFSNLPPALMPRPLQDVRDVWSGLVTIPIHQGALARNGYIEPWLETLKVVAIGYAQGAAIGICLASLMASWRLLDRVLLPILAAIQSMPLIGLAPLYVIWFGFNGGAERMMTTTIVVFPVMVSTRAGFASVSDGRRMLAHSFSSSRWRTLRYVSIPTALPQIMTGLELAVVYALLGAVGAQFLSGGDGLGSRIVLFQSFGNIRGIFSALLLLALTGFSLHRIVLVVHRKLVFWSE